MFIIKIYSECVVQQTIIHRYNMTDYKQKGECPYLNSIRETIL